MNVVFLKIPTLVLLASLASAPQQLYAEPQAPQTASGEQIDLPVSLSKIKEAVSRAPVIRTEGTRPVFRVEVIAKKLSIVDILGKDYLIGPVPYGGMTHQEFLNMVTPVEYRGYSMFSNTEGMMVAATSVAMQWALLKAVDKLRDARTEHAKEAARKEVLDAMNELDEARKKAGLPSIR